MTRVPNKMALTENDEPELAIGLILGDLNRYDEGILPR